MDAIPGDLVPPFASEREALPVTSPPEAELTAWTEDLSVWAELGVGSQTVPTAESLEIILAGG